MYKKRDDPVEYFIKNTHKVKILSNGIVTIFSCKLIKKAESIYLIQGSIFPYQEGQPVSIASNVSTELMFPREAGILQRDTKQEMIRQLKIKVNSVRLRYGRLPRKLHHFYEYETMQKQLKKLEKDIDTVRIDIKFFYGDMVIVFAGRYLKYSFIDKVGDNQYEFRKSANGEIFSDFDVQLMDSDEIINVFEIGKDKCL